MTKALPFEDKGQKPNVLLADVTTHQLTRFTPASIRDSFTGPRHSGRVLNPEVAKEFVLSESDVPAV